MYKQINPILDFSVRQLCFRAYTNHPKGCPNYNHKVGCPPISRTIDEKINLSKPVFVIWSVFNFAAHCKKMKEKHSNWSKRQIECCLYWQPTARKQLKEYVHKFLLEHKKFIIINCPEGDGVNVTSTMKSIGINLEWPPVNITYQIVLAGYSL
ncbi:hypothetical protein LCGC14_0422900 [marine sediment metagenome]|uniref:DUF2284 domain-containing protein n=1 Tax=marine sediment metagenome TaxID=412755 RepID=A0A0F9T8E8_9ZZZZ